MNRRSAVRAISAIAALNRFAWATTAADGRKLATAALAQVGVTVGYDPRWTQIAYPNGDVPRSTGVCADVVIRAARDALGLDLQKLVHEDMMMHFEDYPARHVWRAQRTDTSIDHRRVLNLETYFQRCGACLWHASAPTPGDTFPKEIAIGDILTWLLGARLPHIGIVIAVPSNVPALKSQCRIVHNIGHGAEEIRLTNLQFDRAAGHYRWPVDH